jgi:flagellar basal body-associated protein FliL
LEFKGTSFILIIIITVLTLALAALAGYIFLVQDNNPGETAAVVQYGEVPDDSELSTIELFEGNKYFNLKNTDPNKISVIQVGISLQYFKEIKQNKNIIVPEKINAYLPEIKELIGTYFLSVSLEDVKQPDFKQQTKEELKARINELLNTGDLTSYEYVYKVIFDDWLFQ